METRRGDYDVGSSALFPGTSIRNLGDLPGMNFSFHWRLFLTACFALHCPHIAEDIETVSGRSTDSLGGAVEPIFTVNTQARQFAHTVWDMFLGGASDQLPRLFDDVV